MKERTNTLSFPQNGTFISMAQSFVSKHKQLRKVGYVLLASSLLFLSVNFVDSKLFQGALTQISGLLNAPRTFGGASWASFLDQIQLRKIGLPATKEERISTPSLPEASEVVVEKISKAPDPKVVEESILWLARCMLSETNRPDEMRLVAWVIRNRYETRYRGVDSYKGVVLEPYQFSAFNPGYPLRSHFMGLERNSKRSGWKNALKIAMDVMNAPAEERPFSVKTRHFYSEISMPGRVQPNWASGRIPVFLDNANISAARFRFYRDII